MRIGTHLEYSGDHISRGLLIGCQSAPTLNTYTGHGSESEVRGAMPHNGTSHNLWKTISAWALVSLKNLVATIHYNTMQHNTIQYTTKYNTVQCVHSFVRDAHSTASPSPHRCKVAARKTTRWTARQATIALSAQECHRCLLTPTT